MKKFNVVINLMMQKYANNFDWLAIILVPLIYGLMLIKDTESIWSLYQFNSLFLTLALPEIFGLVFVGVSLLLLIAKKTRKKRIKAIALAVSSFAWSIVAAMFIFAIPSNSVWILSGLMVSLGWKIGAEQ